VEHPAGFEVRYDAVKVDGYSRRTLITIPRPNGRFPAVLWVAGSGCGSQEDPSGGAPTVELLYELTRRGFVTMRVEKSGTGDSEGPPCYSDSGGVAQEVRDYTAALGALRSFPFVDANRVYLFGHSVGATLAPMVAKGQKIQGIVVAGGMGTNFVSYMRAMFQKDLELAGRSTDEIQPTMKVVGRCTSRLFLDRQPPGSVESSMPDCKRYVHYDSPPPYLQDLADANLGKIWEDAPPVPVLVLYGSGDFVTNLAESEALKGTINRAHPATAILKVLAMDHEFRQAESQQDAWRSEQGQIPPRPLLSDAVDEVQRFLSRAP
jgi:dienelactone hydrolase